MTEDYKRRLRRHSLLVAASATLLGTGAIAHAQEMSKNVTDQIASLEDEKAARTPAQQKMDSQLIYANKMNRGLAISSKVQTLEVDIPEANDGNALVDITADVTPALLQAIADAGGTVQSSFPTLHAIRASLPLDQIEGIAASSSVQNIRPADQYHLVGVHHKQFGFAHQPGVVPQSGLATGTTPLVPLAAPAKHPAQISKAEIARLLTQVRAARRQHAAQSATDVAGIPGLFALNFSAHPDILGSFLTPIVSLGASFTTNAVLAPASGSVADEGDTTHRANLARSTFGATGAGLKIGVLSDSIDDTSGSYAKAVTSGDVSSVTVLSGQAGSGAGEGLAMLEIVHDLAPDAQLYFATANSTQAQFATNIRNLRAAGCDIIIDDVFYYAELVFQDGTVAQAVNDVTASGALYFSSAGNEYYLGGPGIAGTSGVWEGDFYDSGISTSTLKPTGYTKTATFHNFAGVTGATGTQDPIYVFNTSSSTPAYLFWSDPGLVTVNGVTTGSTNDYDLFYTNAGGTTITSAGTTTQSAASPGNPYETITVGTTATNRRVLIVKAAAAASRFLHLTLYGNVFYSTAVPFYATNGQTAGHSSAADAFSVAAAPAVSPGPYPGVFSTSSPPETFTSDGPRRIFYTVDSSGVATPITAGNFSSTGGAVRPKPDVTAADGVTTTLPTTSGLNPFYGTSAAAPHAGAVAALLKSYNPALSTGQIRSILTSTAIDIAPRTPSPLVGTTGYDNVTGYGIVDAYSAIAAAPTPALLPITLSPDTVSGGSGSTGTITLRDPSPAGGVTLPLTVTGPASAPSSVTIPAGATSATFPITTSVVSTTAIATFKTTYLTETKTAFLSIVAAYTASGRVTTTSGVGVSGVTISSLVPGVNVLPAMTNSTPVAIPDATNASGTAPGAAVNSPVTFTQSGTVASISVGVNISHTYQTDLQLTLIAPDGTSVILRPYALGGGGSGLVTTFPSPTPSSQPLSALFGKPIAGTWKLQAQDYVSGDTGTINSFTLTLGQNAQLPVTATTASDGTYTFPNFTFVPGTYPLTPSKAGFNFVPASRTVTLGPNATGQDFTLSQAGIRTSATVTTGTDYAVTVTFANGGPDAQNAQVTKATLGTANPTSPAVPTALGTITQGNSTAVTYHFPLTAATSGSTAALKISGTYTGGAFSGTLAVKLP